MQISELFGSRKGNTAYIIGTGPSLRVFPLDFLQSKPLTIGLNKAHLLGNWTYNITIHTELIPPGRVNNWITKRKGRTINWKDNVCYWFKNNSNVKCYDYLTTLDDTLYVGRGIHTAALSLAAKMGCSTAVLVGCDSRAYGEQHHVTGQSTQFHGLPPMGVYREYYLNVREVRTKLKAKFNMDVIYLSPFLGEGYAEEEFEFLLKEKNLDKFKKPMDDSTYQRQLDFQ